MQNGFSILLFIFKIPIVFKIQRKRGDLQVSNLYKNLNLKINKKKHLGKHQANNKLNNNKNLQKYNLIKSQFLKKG
jgi:hypothetical protein